MRLWPIRRRPRATDADVAERVLATATASDMLRWAMGFRHDEVLGSSGSAQTCPVARFLTGRLRAAGLRWRASVVGPDVHAVPEEFDLRRVSAELPWTDAVVRAIDAGASGLAPPRPVGAWEVRNALYPVLPGGAR